MRRPQLFPGFRLLLKAINTENNALPKVSCIIPTHGRPEHLKNSLACLLAQTLPPSEILVVDDIDDPRTATLVEMTARRNDVPVRRIVNRAHPGASGSRNAGALAATSE